MNHGTLTGGVSKEAVNAYIPATAQAPARRRVLFAIATTDSHGAKSFWNCEADGDDVWLDLLLAQAQPGQGVRLEFELATRPFLKLGVHTGEVRFLRVIKAEFPPRRVAAPEPEEVGA